MVESNCHTREYTRLHFLRKKEKFTNEIIYRCMHGTAFLLKTRNQGLVSVVVSVPLEPFSTGTPESRLEKSSAYTFLALLR